MKYIEKFLVGGLTYVPNIANTASTSAQADMAAAASSSSKSKSSDDGLISKEIIKKIIENGIPVDVDDFMNRLANIELDAERGIGVTSRTLRSLQALANRIIQQHSYLENAESNAIKNDSLGEIAVGSRGQLYVMDQSGKIKGVAMNEFDSEKHGPALTVQELVQMRKFNPEKAFDTELTQVINSNIGMTKINEFLRDIISKIGTADTVSEAYVDLSTLSGSGAQRPTQLQFDTIKRIYQEWNTLGPNAIFKLKEELGSKNIDSAYKYIMNILPQHMQLQLRGRYVGSGLDYSDSGEYISLVVSDALTMSNNTTNKIGISFESDLNTAAGTVKKSSTAKDHETSMSGLEQLSLGTLGRKDYTIISKYNPSLAFTLHGTGLGKLMDTKNNLVNESILSDALDSGLGALIDYNNIFLGDQKISAHSLDNIIYDGQDVLNIWAPTRPDGSIDFDKLAKFEELKSQIKANPYLKQEDISELMHLIGIYGTLDANGNFIGNDPNMEQFFVLTGITSDEAFDVDDNEFITTLANKDKDDTFKKIKLIYSTANHGKKGDARREFPQGWWEWSTDLVAGPIFMRVGSTARFDAGTIVGNGARINSQSYQSLIANDQAASIIKPSSNVL